MQWSLLDPSSKTFSYTEEWCLHVSEQWTVTCSITYAMKSTVQQIKQRHACNWYLYFTNMDYHRVNQAKVQCPAYYDWGLEESSYNTVILHRTCTCLFINSEIYGTSSMLLGPLYPRFKNRY